ncbi:Belongs to the helicase [Dionaea muscipula]
MRCCVLRTHLKVLILSYEIIRRSSSSPPVPTHPLFSRSSLVVLVGLYFCLYSCRVRCVNTDTFSPVTKMTSVRLLTFSPASSFWTLHQLDVKNTFIHGDLTEELYLESPGFVAQREFGCVCRLKKSLYGLR